MMNDQELYDSNPRDLVLIMVENGFDPNHLLLCCLKYMSHDDVRGMLHANELSPNQQEDE